MLLKTFESADGKITIASRIREVRELLSRDIQCGSVAMRVLDYVLSRAMGMLPVKRGDTCRQRLIFIYEMHVRGSTMRASSGLPPEQRGAYGGLIQKIPYLKELGITAIELLRV